MPALRLSGALQPRGKSPQTRVRSPFLYACVSRTSGSCTSLLLPAHVRAVSPGPPWLWFYRGLGGSVGPSARSIRQLLGVISPQWALRSAPYKSKLSHADHEHCAGSNSSSSQASDQTQLNGAVTSKPQKGAPRQGQEGGGAACGPHPAQPEGWRHPQSRAPP